MFFFRFSKKSGFWVFLLHPPLALVLLSASVERCFVSRMRDFSIVIPIVIEECSARHPNSSYKLFVLGFQSIIRPYITVPKSSLHDWRLCKSGHPTLHRLASPFCQIGKIHPVSKMDLEVWWFWFYEMVLHCTSHAAQKFTFIFNAQYSSDAIKC